jgi:hypothetical protein
MPLTALTALLATGLLAPAAVVATGAPAAAHRPVHRAVVTVTLQDAVDSLPRHRETRAGYDRDLFVHWIDADGDCFDTRAEVLVDEATAPTTANDDCTITAGAWHSWYDGVDVTDPSSIDIDHMVPLAEAWDSGAKRWTAGTRERFANDLGDPRSLVGVTASSNRSKGDRDPAEWLPDHHRCRYARFYVATKIRWHLRVDRTEKHALRELAAGCPTTTLHVRRAHVRLS